MYTDHVISGAEHERWLESALAASDASYLICELGGRPVGFVSFSNVSKIHGRGSWAFYLGETDVPRGTGPAMEFLALSYAFETLGIRRLCCEVFAFNASVIKLHEKFGFSKEGRLVKHCLKNGAYEDVISLARFQDTWETDKPRLFAVCFDRRSATET